VPGLRLSHTERHLADFWDNPPANFDGPMLRQLRVGGATTLRGVTGLVMPFPYPLTVICGRNGVGKSTILSLAALSARPPADWRVFWGNTRPRTQPDARARYAFNDFFHRPRGGPHPEGLEITWVIMDRGNELEITERFQNGRWVAIVDAGRHRRAGDRPVRAIDYVPMARILPAGEFGALRAAFAGGAVGVAEELGDPARERLSFVMGRQYDRAATRYVRGLGLPEVTANVTYSGFDMGSGENSVVVLLSRLQSAPRGALVVVEEVELGLHPEAQERLMKVLLDYCEEKRLQIVCTTHSDVVIDSVPRRARVLLRRQGGQSEALDNVSTRFAIHEMLGRVQPELLVYTEDFFAVLIVEEAIAGPIRARVSVRDVGSNATLARQAVSHLRTGSPIRALSAFDGDCTEAQVRGWIHGERGERDLHPIWAILPGDGLAPERWVLRELTTEPYRSAFSQELACSPKQADAHLEAMRVRPDHHDCGHTLSLRTGLEPDDARRKVVRAVARNHPALQPLRDQIERLLHGVPDDV
jgi:predicted ATPase